MTQTIKDHLSLHVLVFLWGFTAILGKLIILPSVEMVWYRTGLSALGLLVVIRLFKHSFHIHGNGNIKRIWIAGIFFGIHWITFFMSVKVSNVSTCLIGMASTAFWTSFLEPMIRKKQFHSLKVIFSVIGAFGVLIIFSTEDVAGFGLTLALISAFCSSIFTILNADLSKNNSHFTITLFEMLIAFGSISLFLLARSFFATETTIELVPTTMDWLYLMVLALVCTVFAYSYAVKLMKRLSPFTINFTLNLEPVYGILLAVALFGDSEVMSGQFYVGAAIILLAVISYPIILRRLSPVKSNLQP